MAQLGGFRIADGAEWRKAPVDLTTLRGYGILFVSSGTLNLSRVSAPRLRWREVVFLALSADKEGDEWPSEA